jgi:hypothetical protein
MGGEEDWASTLARDLEAALRPGEVRCVSRMIDNRQLRYSSKSIASPNSQRVETSDANFRNISSHRPLRSVASR